MKFEQLKAFVTVVETGSFRAAADVIHKTQPSISAAVKALESQYGIQLFNRNSYRPTLTAEGHAFFKQAKKLIYQAQQLDRLGNELAHGAEVALPVCIGLMCMNNNCLHVVKQFQLSCPDISLEITSDHLYGVQEQLRNGRAEIAIGPRYGLDDRHIFTEIMKIDMVTVVAPELLEQLAVEQPIKQAALERIPQLLVRDGGRSTGADDSHRHILISGKRWYLSDFQAKKMLLRQGFGWARMPRYMVADDLESGTLIAVEVEQFASKSRVPIFMVRLRNQVLSSQGKQFWDYVLEQIPKNG